MPSPGGADHQPLKPICELEGVRQVFSSSAIPVEEIQCEGQGKGASIGTSISLLRGHAISARDNSFDSSTKDDAFSCVSRGGIRQFRGHSTGTPSFPDAGHSDELRHDTGGPISPGTCTRSSPDDHAVAEPRSRVPAVELNSADNMEEDQWSSVTGELQNPNDQQTSDH